MSKFVKFLFWTIVAIYCSALAYDLYVGHTGGAILMCIGLGYMWAIRWIGGRAVRYDARVARTEQGADTSV
jgi:hypothetical protein